MSTSLDFDRALEAYRHLRAAELSLVTDTREKEYLLDEATDATAAALSELLAIPAATPDQAHSKLVAITEVHGLDWLVPNLITVLDELRPMISGDIALEVQHG